MSFYFKAIDGQGKLHKGYYKAASEQELIAYLDTQNLSLVRYFSKSQKFLFDFKKTASFYEVYEFCLYMENLSRASLTLVDSLKAFQKNLSNRALSLCISSLIESLKQGKSLAVACANHPKIFDPIVCAMLAAGEQQGDFISTFAELAQLYKWRYEMKKRIWKSVRYPLIILFFIIILLALVFTVVIPQLTSFLLDFQKELSYSTKVMLFVSLHLDKILIGGSSIFIFSVLMLWYIKRLSDHARFFIDRILICMPGIGKLMHKVEIQRFLQIFVSLLQRHLPILSAFSFALENVHNLFLRQVLYKVQKEIENGNSFSQSWEHQAFLVPLVGRIAYMGEASGQLAESLKHGISFLKREIEYSTDKIISLIEPAAIIILGTIILWIILSVVLPVYDQMTSFSV